MNLQLIDVFADAVTSVLLVFVIVRLGHVVDELRANAANRERALKNAKSGWLA